MAGSLSPLLSLNGTCAYVVLKQKIERSAESTACFLKPNSYPVCRRMALGMAGEKGVMKQIKMLYIRGYSSKHEEPMLEAIRMNMDLLEAKVDVLGNYLEQNVEELNVLKKQVDGLTEKNHMNSSVETSGKKLESATIHSALSDKDKGIGTTADKSPRKNADAPGGSEFTPGSVA